MALDPGTLNVNLQYAKDIRNCDWFGRQDPYVKYVVNDCLGIFATYSCRVVHAFNIQHEKLVAGLFVNS